MLMKNSVMRMMALAVLTLCCSAHAIADEVVPNATFRLFAGGQNANGPGEISGSSCGGTGGGGCETSTASATTSLTLTTSGTGSVQWGTNTSAVVAIYYEVVGGTNVSVPITIAGYGSTSLSAFAGYSFSEIDGETGAPALVCTAINEPGECTSNSSAGPLTQSLSVTSNTVYAFVLETGCSAVDGTCSSFLDPTVSIDPTFLADNSGYSIVLSPNVTTPSGVPEPATLSLLGLGLAGIGFMRKRKLN